MTFDQQEPSANSPCTKTTFLVFGDVWALTTRLSRGRVALAAATPINVRRFIIVSPTELRAICGAPHPARAIPSYSLGPLRNWRYCRGAMAPQCCRYGTI